MHKRHKGQLDPRGRALGTMNKKFDRGVQKAVHPFRLNNFEHLILSPHSRFFESYFDVILLMYLVSSGFLLS